VERLHDALKDRGYEVWVDFEDIPPSAEWFEEIRGGLLAADGVLFVISPDSVKSEVCGRELDEAVAQHKRVVPVVYRDPRSATVPEAAAALNWVFLRDSDDFDAGLGALLTALETDLEHVHTHTRLGVAAERWQASDRDRSQLLRGAELAAAEAWLLDTGAKEPQPTQLQREYLLASRQAATRRQRTIIGAVSLALLVAIALGVLALVQRNDAINNLHTANAALDDTEALANYATDPQRSVAEAVAAVGIIASPQTTARLREALAQSHLRAVFNPRGGATPDAIWNPAGTRLLVTSPEVSAKIYRPLTSSPPVSIAPPTSRGEVAWDAAGDRVVVGGARPAIYNADTGALIRRLPGAALHVALSSDGSLVATTDLDSVGHVYEVASGAQLSSFAPAYRGGVTCFAWAPNDSVIAQCDAQSATNASTPASLDLWDPRTGRLLRSDHANHYIGSVSFSPDTSLYAYTTTNTAPTEPTLALQVRADAAAAGEPGTLVYSTRTGALVKTFPGGATAATFSPTEVLGIVLGYATVDAVGHVYNFDSKLDEPLVGDTAAINAISFSADGTYVVTASDDGTARVYDPGDGSLLETLADGDVGPVYSASFGLGDTAIATASNDGQARVWSSPQAAPASKTTLAGRTGFPATVAFTTGGARIVEAGLAGGGALIDARSLRRIAGFTAPPGDGYAGALASRDGSLVAALAYRVEHGIVTDGIVQTFDGATGKLLATITPPAAVFLSSASLNETGTRLVTLYGNGDAQQWNPRTGARLALLRGRPRAVLAVYSPDGSTLAIVHAPTVPTNLSLSTRLGPVTIDLWNARSGRFERQLNGPALEPLIPGVNRFAKLALAFSPNSKAIVLSGADQDVYGFSTRSSSAKVPFPVPDGEHASSVAFSPNSRLLAAGTAAAAYVWNLHTGEVLPVFQHADPSEFAYQAGYGVAVSFTRDSQVLVTVGDDELRAWDVSDHLPLFEGFTGQYGQGALDLAGNEAVTGDVHDLSVYRCRLCGGLSDLLAAARGVPKG
jgi:WD40 repeat protein